MSARSSARCRGDAPGCSPACAAPREGILAPWKTSTGCPVVHENRRSLLRVFLVMLGEAPTAQCSVVWSVAADSFKPLSQLAADVPV